MKRSTWTTLIVFATVAIIGGTVMTEKARAAKYYDAEMLTVIWEADPEVVAKMLPPPLKPYKRPIVVAFIANFPRTSIGVTYKMSALSIICEYEGEVGTYSVTMPEDDDHAVFSGREFLGFPKKMATLDFSEDETSVSGWVERHDIRVFELSATKTGAEDFGDAEEIIKELYPEPNSMDGVSFIIRGSTTPGAMAVDYPPQLIRQVTQFRAEHIEICDVEVTVRPSMNEPWWDMLKPVKVLGAMFTRGNNEMLPPKVIAEVPIPSLIQDMGYSYDLGFGGKARQGN
jgi:acetoacetate decarboxylase